jgi:hypothetical protein
MPNILESFIKIVMTIMIVIFWITMMKEGNNIKLNYFIYKLYMARKIYESIIITEIEMVETRG